MEIANIDLGFDPTNYFVYKNKKYPLNLDVFKSSSKKIQNDNYQKNQDITLLDDNEKTDFPESSIELFLLYSHNDQRKEIDDHNVVYVNYLAKKYENYRLIQKTEYIISQNPQKYRIQQLMMNKNNDLENIQLIKEISSQLDEIIKTTQKTNLLKLSLSQIWGILNEYKEISKSSVFSDEIIEFLLDCLNEKGREASVLFNLLDFDKIKKEYIHILYTKYSKIFDFNFLNGHCCKTIYESQAEIIKEQSIMNAKLTHELENQKQINLNLQNQIDELKKIVSNLHIHCPYSEPSKGILSFLTNRFVLTAGGENPSGGPVTNLLKYDDSKFYNYTKNNKRTKEKKDECWILFDFKSMKVIIDSYYIRSNYSEPNKFHHPKTWALQGSDDNNNWEIIDERKNDESLNGEYKEKLFICNKNNNKAYRYIRYLQDECWSDKKVAGDYYNLYNIYITYFQLYGDVVASVMT